MKTKFYTLLIVLVLLNAPSVAQFEYPEVEDYGLAREFMLGYPDTDEGVQFLPIGIDLWEGDDVNAIHYGQIPPNSGSKPVIVFVHGYATNAQVWFKGDDNMYWDVYRDGYRSAFVSLTPNRHMWTNGKMLASMIDRITARYGVDKVVLVGWSKGGVDIDAALVHNGSNGKVSEVFTLNAPHYGTGIAELANSILLSLVNIIFMQNNDATVCLQRGYMNYFRSVTDNHINNTVNYTTFGAWGNGPLNRLSIPQGYLYLAGGSKSSGGNDGVVPYIGNRRPGGRELFGGQRKEYFLGIPYYTGPKETKLDHYELTRGGLVWSHIKANLSGNSTNFSQTEHNYNPNAQVSSKIQLVTGMRGKKNFFIEEDAGKVTVMIISETTEAPKFSITGKNGQEVKKYAAAKQAENQSEGSIYILEEMESGEYFIESDQPFAAVIMPEQGIEARLNTGLTESKLVYNSGETVHLTLDLNTDEGHAIEQARVSGTMTRTNDLKLNAVDDNPHIITFKKNGHKYIAEVKEDLPSGIYNITVTAQGSSFVKNVIASIAVVGDDEKAATDKSTDLSIENIYPNPFQDNLTIHVKVGKENTKLIVYNIFGQKVKSFDLSGQHGNIELQWSTKGDNIDEGLYILQLTNGKTKLTKKVMMRK